MQLLTYPARPVNGGHLNQALPKRGQWFYEPKYNGWRAIVHTPTSTMWNRHGELLSITREFESALEILKCSPLEWLDVEALERRHNLGRGSLVVLDCPSLRGLVYEQRTRRIYDSIGAMGLGECLIQTLKPEANKVYIAPSYGETELRELWQQLQEVNRCLKSIFYEGVVAKKANSLYPVQLNSPEQATATWMKHRFIK
jgi:ATP-dependent DNA ligase